MLHSLLPFLLCSSLLPSLTLFTHVPSFLPSRLLPPLLPSLFSPILPSLPPPLSSPSYLLSFLPFSLSLPPSPFPLSLFPSILSYLLPPIPHYFPRPDPARERPRRHTQGLPSIPAASWFLQGRRRDLVRGRGDEEEGVGEEGAREGRGRE